MPADHEVNWSYSAAVGASMGQQRQ